MAATVLRRRMNAQFHYTGIRVKDLDASIAFYTNVLGMTVRGRATIPESHGVVVDLASEGSSHPLELNYYEPGSRFDVPFTAGEGLDHLAFRVTDLDRAIAEAAAAGAPVAHEVRTSQSRWVYLRDPNGIWIELSA